MKNTFFKKFFLLLIIIIFTISTVMSQNTLAATPATLQASNPSLQPILKDLTDRMSKLNSISRLDPSLNPLALQMQQATTNLNSMTYEYVPYAWYNPLSWGTANVGKLNPTKMYLTDKFFNSDYFEATGADQSNKYAISQMGILLHEAIHSDQNLLNKTFNAITSLGGNNPMPILGSDKTEFQAYMSQYVMLRLLGADVDWHELKNTLQGVQENRDASVQIFDVNDKLKISQLERNLGLTGILTLLDGGIDAAYDRLMRYNAMMPAGNNTKFRLKIKVETSDGKPFAGAPVTIRNITDPVKEKIIMKTSDLNGDSFSYANSGDYLNWIEIAKMFAATNTYKAYINGATSTLLEIKLDNLFDTSKFTKDSGDCYTINVGTITVNTSSNTKQASARPFKAKLTDNKGQPIPADRISASKVANYDSTSTNVFTDAVEIISNYAGKLAVVFRCSIPNETTGKNGLVSRTVITDGGEVSLQFEPVPDYSNLYSGWDSTKTPEQKKAAYQAYLSQIESFFNKAIVSNGIHTGTGNEPSMADYYTLTSNEEYSCGSDNELKTMWDEMKQRQMQQVMAKANEQIQKLNDFSTKKDEIHNKVYGQNADPEVKEASVKYEPELSYSSKYEEVMDVYTHYMDSYDKMIKAYGEYVTSMDAFYSDSALWDAVARYRDLRSFSTDIQFYNLDTLLDTFWYIYTKGKLQDIIKAKESCAIYYEGEIDKAIVQDAEREAREAEASYLMGNAEGELGELAQNSTLFATYDPSSIVDKTISISLRLKEYIDWQEGRRDANTGWGTNYTVTLLYEDIQQLYQVMKGLSGAIGIDEGISTTGYGQEALAKHLRTLSANLPIISALHESAKKYAKTRNEISQNLLRIEDLDPGKYTARINAVQTTLSGFTDKYPYQNDELFSKAVTDITQYAQKYGVAGTTKAPSDQSTTSPQNITIVVNGSPVYSDVPPQVINGRTMVPVRAAAEALNCTVNWRGSDQTAIITSPGKAPADVATGNGQLRVVVDGVEIKSDVPPTNIQGRVLIPFRFVAEAIGAKVDWDGVNKQVIITMGSN